MACCKNIMRCLLIFVNIFFFLIGGLLAALGIVIRWGSIKEVEEIIEKAKEISFIDLTYIETIAILLLSLGIIILVVALFGLIGACCMSKCFLVMYDALCVLMFMAHIGVIVYIIIKLPNTEEDYKKKLDQQIYQVNSNPSDLKPCVSFRILSEIFKCCGSSGPDDFNTTIARDECCKEEYKDGCSSKLFKTIRDNALNYVVIPNGIVCLIELIIIVGTAILIRRGHGSKPQPRSTVHRQPEPSPRKAENVQLNVIINNNANVDKPAPVEKSTSSKPEPTYRERYQPPIKV